MPHATSLDRNAHSDSAGDARAPLGWADLLARLTLAAIFIWSGFDKLVHPANTVAYMNAYHVPLAEALVWPAAVLELAGGALLVAGWRARWAALALAAYTLLAALIFHNFWAAPPEQALNQTIHFMKNVAIFGGLLHIFACGCGRFSADRR